MKRKSIYILLLIVLAFSVVWVYANNNQNNHDSNHQAEKVENTQELCPIMGKEVNKEVYTDYKGQRIYFCCASCIDEFNENPKLYMKALEKQGIKLEATPTCGKCGEQNCHCSSSGCSHGSCSSCSSSKI